MTNDIIISVLDINYVKRKVRIWTILGFCCANLGSELWRNNPRIAHANIGSEDLLRKPQIHTQSSRIAQPNSGHPWQQTHDRLRKRSSSAIHRNEATTDRARKAVRPSAAKVHERSHSSPIRGNEAQSIAQSRTHTPALQATMVNHRGFVATDGRAALRALSIVGLLPRMAEIWLRDPR